MFLLLALQLHLADPLVYNWTNLGYFESKEQCLATASAIDAVNEGEVKAMVCVPTKKPGKDV